MSENQTCKLPCHNCLRNLENFETDNQILYTLLGIKKKNLITKEILPIIRW